jgi:hypothetical protein
MSPNSEILVEIIAVVTLLCVGGIALLRPQLLQRLAIQAPFTPWRHYVTTKAYLAHVRIIGVMTLAMASILALDLYVRWSAR